LKRSAFIATMVDSQFWVFLRKFMQIWLKSC